MNNPRKENRLNLRFPDSETIDELEICAAKKGLKLPEWARAKLMKIPLIEKFRALLFRRSVESIFVTQKLLEQLCTQDQIQKAKSDARTFVTELEKHVHSQQ